MPKVHRLRVHRRGFHVRATVFKRKGKTIHRKAFGVSPATFKIRDVGAVGRGKKIIPPLKKGGLGGVGYFKKSTMARRKLIVKLAKKQGEKTIGSRLSAIGVLTKRTHPHISHMAFADRHYLMGAMKGKTVVGYPEGFKRVR